MESNHSFDIILYGARRCHKTQFYLNYFKERNLELAFFDVEKDLEAAINLRKLYTSGKLNFPTIIIQGKKLRNPSIDEIEKWLLKKGK